MLRASEARCEFYCLSLQGVPAGWHRKTDQAIKIALSSDL